MNEGDEIREAGKYSVFLLLFVFKNTKFMVLIVSLCF